MIAQSALTQSPAATGLDLSSEVIVCTPGRDIAEYQGTRATLEAEGVIPAGTQWPEGFESLHWEDDKFSYWLRRTRPEGLKGPRKQLLEIDWWAFRCNPVRHSWGAKAIEEKAKALAYEIYRQSAEGRAEWEKRWAAYWEAQKDERFQAFKSTIPGINRPKRGRRPKNAEQSKGAAA